MRITAPGRSHDSALRDLPPGIYPYVGSSAGADRLRALVHEMGYAAVPGARGVKLANEVPDTLVDPALYGPAPKGSAAPGSLLFDYDEWLERQRQAKVPIVLTDGTRIRKDDRESLRAGVRRWRDVGDPTLAVLPIEAWWLQGGLPALIEEVRSARRPVALVLHAFFNGLDAARAVAGLVTFISSLEDVPVVLLRFDVSGIGAVAHGGHAAFIGHSAGLRHGPMPRRPRENGKDDDPDVSPHVFVPALHQYLKASNLPAIARDEDADILACHDDVCRGASLLRIPRLSEIDLKAARAEAYRHNAASHERVARTVFASDEPKDAWWELCKSGADTTASLVERGLSLPIPPWLRQWIELGSPAHAPATVR